MIGTPDNKSDRNFVPLNQINSPNIKSIDYENSESDSDSDLSEEFKRKESGI